jgi:hypothetical protein
MGFSVYYRSTLPVAKTVQDAILEAADAASDGRTWLSCEPICFFRCEDGYLGGGSKPNYMPHPDDAADAASQGLPDGTLRDVLDILCRLSRDHSVDWEISHDHGDEPVGYIHGEVRDDEVSARIEGLADLGNILTDVMADSESQADGFPPSASGAGDADEDDDDGPTILSFRPREE